MLKFFIFLPTVLVALVIPNLGRHSRNEPAPLALDFTVEERPATGDSRYGVSKRDLSNSTYAEGISKRNASFYMLDVSLGSNNQTSRVAFDTGSTSFWVPSSNYNHSTSETAIDLDIPFNKTYLYGDFAKGEYFLDTLQLSNGDLKIKDFLVAEADEDDIPGVLGVGGKKGGAADPFNNTFPWALKRAGYTPKASYSLYLNKDNETGVVIFGGVDHDKYHGELDTYAMDPTERNLALNVQSLSINGTVIDSNVSFIFDSGSNGIYTDPKKVIALRESFGARIDGIIDCDQPEDQYITVDFGRTQVNISYADATIRIGDGRCMVGAFDGRGRHILGGVFLKQVYTYFDLSNETIGIAPVKYD